LIPALFNKAISAEFIVVESKGVEPTVLNCQQARVSKMVIVNTLQSTALAFAWTDGEHSGNKIMLLTLTFHIAIFLFNADCLNTK
jgi:hypothetical protein